MTPERFAALVGLSRDDVERYRSLGLLDPEDDGLLDDVDLVRLDFVRHRLARREYDPESLAAAIRDGRVESMYGKRLFEAGLPLGLDEAAARARLEPDQLRQLTSAVGFSWGLRESDVEILEVLRVALDAGLPWEASLGVTRVVADSLRRIADAEIRAVRVYIHERLTAAGASGEDLEQLISGIEQNLAPLLDPMFQWLHREYLVEAMIENEYLHLTDAETPARDLGSVEATVAFLDIASFTALAESSGDDTAMQVLDQIDTIVRSLLVERDGDPHGHQHRARPVQDGRLSRQCRQHRVKRRELRDARPDPPHGTCRHGREESRNRGRRTRSKDDARRRRSTASVPSPTPAQGPRPP
jgi:Adenylate cyclase regulatory domain